MADQPRMTVPRFAALKDQGRKITMLTAYDYTMAGLLDATGIEGILVGDSLSMVVQGHDTTLPVKLEEMIYHAEMVGRAVGDGQESSDDYVSASVNLPPGSRVVGMTADGDRLSLLIEDAAGHQRVMTVDRRSGAVLGILTLEPE